MKISLVYDFLKELGGLERMMFFHSNTLKKNKKFKPELFFGYISENQKNKLTSELELKQGTPIHKLRKLKGEISSLASLFLMPQSLNKIKTDLVIAYSFMTSRLAFNKKKYDGTPYIVVICHPPNFIYSDVKGWANNLSRKLAKFLGIFFKSKIKSNDIESVRNADAVIAISEYTAVRVRNIYGINPQIIYPPVSSFFRPLSSNEISKFIKEKKINRPFLYSHGRIIPDKNIEFLLDIIKKIEGYDLILSGSISEDYKLRLNQKINDLGLSDRVKLLGRIPKSDLQGYYSSAKLFLVPARKEDFGLTLIESIASGTPVIAWDDGAGPSEILTPGISGLLAKPYDEKDYLLKIKQGLKKNWDKKALQVSINKFREDFVGKKFAKVLTSLKLK